MASAEVVAAAGRSRGRAGFTMVELLVTISIILLLAAASIPMISAFKGQRLEQSARMVVSVLNDARRRAITQHGRCTVVFYAYEDPSDPILKQRHALRVYMEPVGRPGSPRYFPGGYVGKMVVLPKGVQFDPAHSLVRIWTLGRIPDPAQPLALNDPYFQKGNAEALAFRTDGSIADRVDFPAVHPAVGRNIYLPDEGCYQVPEDTRADIVLIEVTPAGVEKVSDGKKRRALIDLVPMTGRALMRVFDVSPDGFAFFNSTQP
ncbi:MAG: prepilin-type N-terminal cleavage/methylation domain-containing protein [Planctomycetota bacterium]|nr:MAG: prepilin-type N-terminal cleavage/methylation domain-containing protein [Planctomycetota bacterium]